MQIETLLKPKVKPVRNVTVFGKVYTFKPIVPGRFVAEVNEEKAAQALIATGAYREFTDQLPAATLQAPAATATAKASTAAKTAASAKPQTTDTPPADTQPPVTTTVASDTTTTAPSVVDAVFDEATTTAAQSLLSGHPLAVKKGAAQASKEVIAAALSIEEKAAKPRASVVTTLQEALKG